MKVFSKVLGLNTDKRIDLVNITAHVKNAVRESGVTEGLVNIFCAHTTAGLYVNEDEPNLRRDVEAFLAKLAPIEAQYQHNQIDDNAHAHLRNLLLSAFLIIPLVRGEPKLGTWQSIFCAEADGPRKRELLIQVLGE